MSDTPRSDEVFFAQHEEAGYALEAMYDKSCELERELAAQEKVSDELEDAIKLLLKELDEAKSELAAAKREIAQLQGSMNLYLARLTEAELEDAKREIARLEQILVTSSHPPQQTEPPPEK